MIPFLFYLLFFCIPLIVYPYTSELFEFNKMLFVYTVTILIIGLWIIKMLQAKKIIFSRTIFDIPLVIFLISQSLSTLISIDFRTSLLGYYSRFNGGLISTLCYTLLFWAFVSNIDKKYLTRYIYALLFSTTIVSVYAILEHFGFSFSCLVFTGKFNVDCWVQDVQSRVFATFGQPNWLAAWLTALIPLTFLLSLKKKLWIVLSAIFFLTLLYTKSRSGLLAFLAADVIFWSGYFYISKKFNWSFLVSNLAFSVLFLVNLSPTPALTNSTTTALESGGTESGTIRKIVWKGAIDIWKHYPILGTGVETFAYSYYGFRPVEHNLVSEWDFLYNKAHNEFLNYAANTGTVGLISYLILIGTFVIFTLKNLNITNLALLSGYTTILITNFFGFSVVPIQILFFLFPAFALTRQQITPPPHSNYSKTLVYLTLIAIAYCLVTISRYWLADTYYAKKLMAQALRLSPHEAIYWGGLSEIDAKLGLVDKAVLESNQAYSLSPKNISLLRQRASVFLRLATVDPNYILEAKDTLLTAIKLAPTDAKLQYNLGLIYSAIGQEKEAQESYKTALKLKPDYQDAQNKLK